MTVYREYIKFTLHGSTIIKVPPPPCTCHTCSQMGISNDTHVVVYDNHAKFGFYSAGRVWWIFKVSIMGQCIVMHRSIAPFFFCVQMPNHSLSPLRPMAMLTCRSWMEVSPSGSPTGIPQSLDQSLSTRPPPTSRSFTPSLYETMRQ